jgi:hypothetical protein
MRERGKEKGPLSTHIPRVQYTYIQSRNKFDSFTMGHWRVSFAYFSLFIFIFFSPSISLAPAYIFIRAENWRKKKKEEERKN